MKPSEIFKQRQEASLKIAAVLPTGVEWAAGVSGNSWDIAYDTHVGPIEVFGIIDYYGHWSYRLIRDEKMRPEQSPVLTWDELTSALKAL